MNNNEKYTTIPTTQAYTKIETGEMPQRPIILGSKSPRRKELLEQLGYNFVIQTQDSEEIIKPGLSPEEVVVSIALQKAEAFNVTDNSIIITADTVVAVDSTILAKAANYDEAYKMISMLSGRAHKVISAVCLKTWKGINTFYETTHVHFKKLAQDEIDYYIKNYQPFDKAGAYGIQEWIGMIGIEKIEGCYYNVVGLPTRQLHIELQKLMTSA